MYLSDAEVLLQELGVSDPKEIDLEAIAFHVNARVRYRNLVGCDACIVGHSDKAIITVKQDCHPQRKRFSIAHELGHWHCHRGQQLACNVDAISPENVYTERQANDYAADLIMPWYLFSPMVQKLSRISFKEIDFLSKEFESSKTATAIRLVERGSLPVVLVCHRQEGRKWFKRSPIVPSAWFPKKQLDPESYAMDVQFGAVNEDFRLRKIKASAWFDQSAAYRFDVQETTIRVGSGETLTVLLLPSGMLS